MLLQTIRPGPEVIISPYTVDDVVNMVVAGGGVPKFADIEEETCNISPDEVEKLIGPRTCAVLITHMHGLVAPLGQLRAICDSRRVPLLEDACQAFGAQYGGRKAGTSGSMGFFNCGCPKNINAFLGGMIATNDLDKAANIRKKLSARPYEHRKRLAKRIAHCAVGQVLTSPLVFPPAIYWKNQVAPTIKVCFGRCEDCISGLNLPRLLPIGRVSGGVCAREKSGPPQFVAEIS